ncbi:RNA polymerase sigma factor [Frigoriglobus tundricola]|uniref:ECF RNA polymerase sigma factor SigE n=1 Tax=Frigoriglobus tundricola TaxID=2774151 RepID=A0A6M5Z2T9_9BACT|nr:RNA polymerase sigma factor [Frigoriglobus tundricola]QJX00559.1 hypothetical protein FTUN_8189 [Frigoriglobus tundricola]
MGVPDSELLHRFTLDRDEAAFELLVWRHGSMVLGVCRRAIRDEQLAEDAFQAVFLVLARKAAAVRGNLGGWLYKVARRVATRAQKKHLSTQPVIETVAAPVPDLTERDEITQVLDTEVARLPERLRRPVVLCYLGGWSTEDAAREIGCPRGTVLSRLATARKHLADRLVRRGVTLPAALATVGVSGRLVSTATGAVSRYLTGTLSSSTAAQLANGVIQTMSRATLLGAMSGLLLAATLVTGVGWVTAQPGEKPAGASAPTAPVAADPRPEQPTPPPKAAQPEPDVARKAVALKIRTLERFAETLSTEIEATEKHLELLSKANGLGDNQRSIREKQIVETEEEYRRQNREVNKLEAELFVLRKRLENKHLPAPDPILIQSEVNSDVTVRQTRDVVERIKNELKNATPVTGPKETPQTTELKSTLARVEKAYAEAVKSATENAIEAAQTNVKIAAGLRIAKISPDLEIQKEIRERLKDELITVKKFYDQLAATANIAELRKSIEPQRELLARIKREIILLQLQAEGVQLPEVSGAEGKLDAIFRELVMLRKEVQELKEQSKK